MKYGVNDKVLTVGLLWLLIAQAISKGMKYWLQSLCRETNACALYVLNKSRRFAKIDINTYLCFTKSNFSVFKCRKRTIIVPNPRRITKTTRFYAQSAPLVQTVVQ